MKKIFLILIFSCNYAFAQQKQQSVSENIDVRNTTINNRHSAQRAYSFVSPDTAPCSMGIGGGAQGLDVGVSLTGSRESKPCNERKDAFAAAGLGMPDMAQRMYIIRVCSDKMYQYMDECIKLKERNAAFIKDTITIEYKYPNGGRK